MNILSDITNKLSQAFSGTKSESLGPLKDSRDQSPDEVELVSHIRNKIDEIRSSNNRVAIEQNYLTNVAYLLGFDGVYYDSVYRQFKNADPKRKLSRNRFKVNKILPTCQNRLARLTKSPPRYEVRPNSNSTEDKDSARLGLQVLNDIFEKQNFNEKRQDVHMSAMQGGVSYLQTTWDPNLGKPMYDPGTGEFTGYEGDVRYEVLNSLEIFPDPLAKTIDDCQYIIKAKVRKLDYFRAQYPERGHAVKEESSWLLSALYDMKANSLSQSSLAGSSTQEQMKNSAIEIVYYEKRSEGYENGRRIVIANGVLLENGELPIGEYDISKFDDIVVGSRYQSEAVITHLRPIQDQYNITRTKMADWVKKMLAGKYLSAKGHGLSQESLNNESGEVVEYTMVPNAPPPMPMSIPQMPQYAYKDLEQLDAEFDYISGINEISRGVLPSASIPAQGMAFLQEQDQTRIGVQTTRNEISYARVGRHTLKYVGKNYKLPRVLKIAGDGLEYAVKEFVGSDINDNHDVQVIPGSTIPSSLVLKRQDITNAFNMGLYGNPQDPKVQASVLKKMEFGDVQDSWKKQSLTESRCKKIITLIEQNDLQSVDQFLNEFDNHYIHLQEMDEYRLTDKFDAFSKEQKDKFMYVMEWRLQATVAVTNPQLAQQQLMAEVSAKTMENNMQQYGTPGGPMADMSNALLNPQMQGGGGVQPMVDPQGNIQAPPPQQQPMQQQPA